MMTLEFHEVADIFPLMEGVDFNEFRDDIRKHGLKEPIWLHNGKIIDGRNRYMACQSLGIAPGFREWNGVGDLTAFVVSLNLHRRHLTDSQRAMVAAKIAKKFEKSARERQAHGSTAPGRSASANGNHETLSANWREASSPNGDGNAKASSSHKGEADHSKVSEQAAALLNVSPRSVERATTVLKNGTPELVKAVEQGDVKVASAAQVATLPKPEQAQVVSQGPQAVKAKAKEIRQDKVKGDPNRPIAERYRIHLLKSIADVDDLTRAVAAELRDGGYGGLELVLKLLGRDESLRVAGKAENLIERLQGWEARIKEFYGE